MLLIELDKLLIAGFIFVLCSLLPVCAVLHPPVRGCLASCLLGFCFVVCACIFSGGLHFAVLLVLLPMLIQFISQLKGPLFRIVLGVSEASSPALEFFVGTQKTFCCDTVLVVFGFAAR